MEPHNLYVMHLISVHFVCLLNLQANTTSEANAGFPPASSSDMLEIVCGQRDRFKIRLTEMEQENDRVAKQLEIARAELASYRQDNVKLYEKIRYLQSYNESRAGRGCVTYLPL